MESKLQGYVKYFEKKDEISDANKQAVKWFLRECAVEGLSEVRKQKYVFGFTALLTIRTILLLPMRLSVY